MILFLHMSFLLVKNNDVHGSVINVENASSELLDVAYLYNRVIMDRITGFCPMGRVALNLLLMCASLVIFCDAFPTRGWQMYPSFQRCSRQLHVFKFLINRLYFIWERSIQLRGYEFYVISIIIKLNKSSMIMFPLCS